MFISPFYVILDVFVLFDLYVSILHDIPKMVKVFIKNLLKIAYCFARKIMHEKIVFRCI